MHSAEHLPDHLAAQIFERLEQLVQLQAQSNAHFEELRKTHEQYQKRCQATIEALERRIRVLEETRGTPVEFADSDAKRKERRKRVLTAEQTTFRRIICQEYKDFDGSLPPMEIRKSLSKRLYEEFKDDATSPLTIGVCEAQISNWFYDQIRNKSRLSNGRNPGTAASKQDSTTTAAAAAATTEVVAVTSPVSPLQTTGSSAGGEKKRVGRKRKAEGQGWTPAPTSLYSTHTTLPATMAPLAMHSHHSHHHHHHHNDALDGGRDGGHSNSEEDDSANLAAHHSLPSIPLLGHRDNLSHRDTHGHHHHHHHHHAHHSHHDEHDAYDSDFPYTDLK